MQIVVIWYKPAILTLSSCLLAMSGPRQLRRRIRGKKRPAEQDMQTQPRSVSMSNTASTIGLGISEYGRLRCMGFPQIGYELLKMIVLVSATCCAVDMVEYFCGVASIARSFHHHGLNAVGCDREYDCKFNDLLADCGVIHALTLALHLKEHGCLWFGTVCSSFVWIARASTKRDEQRPLGSDTSYRALSSGFSKVPRFGEDTMATYDHLKDSLLRAIAGTFARPVLGLSCPESALRRSV